MHITYSAVYCLYPLLCWLSLGLLPTSLPTTVQNRQRDAILAASNVQMHLQPSVYGASRTLFAP